MDEAFLNDFRATVADGAARLLALGEDEAGRRPAPGKGSPREIIGHLIDSAANNHSRFVRGQLPGDPQFSYVMTDDVVHLKHHLRQVIGEG